MKTLAATLTLIFLSSFCFLNHVGAALCPNCRFTNETDRQALLAIKDLISEDPLDALSSWNNSLHFCRWKGVRCGRKHQRVTALDLSSLKLVGSLSPHVGNLTFIKLIRLEKNSFEGIVPSEIGRLHRLKELYLANNSFYGNIPMNLSRCSDLRVMNLYGNHLRGGIPSELGSLSKLNRLLLSFNSLTGSLPPSLGNLSRLSRLSLMNNHLKGNIPVELGHLSELDFLQLSSNKFSGKFPEKLLNISSIYFFSLAENQFTGNIPPDLCLRLPKLQFLYLGGNRFSGSVPASIANASGLIQLDMGMNALTGPVPKNLGLLQSLEVINLCCNPLGDENDTDLSFLTSFTNCTNLRWLWFFQNQLRGDLPNSIANLSSNLVFLRLETNYLTGETPPEIGNLQSLQYLSLFENTLTGTLPETIGKLSNLQEFYIYTNKISGSIPSSLGNITQLRRLHLANNTLDGTIPASLGKCVHLEGLDLSFNHLNGIIPEQLVNLSSFTIGLSFASNNLTGRLPSQIGNMTALVALDISDNDLSGIIPSTLGNCLALQSLFLQGNSFEGTIPISFGNLRGMQVLDLSCNNLSGKIPKSLGGLTNLWNLNLSFNELEGEVPSEGAFRNASAISVAGNDRLCGGLKALLLRACPTDVAERQGKGLSRGSTIAVVSVAAFVFLLMAIVAIFICRRRSSRRKKSLGTELTSKHPKVSYADLIRATEGFSSVNWIGDGSYGTVYKGHLQLSDQETNHVVAVKVLKLHQHGANKIFTAECEALRNIKHRNLVKIITSCSTIDFQGNDFKALIFEFMPNGNLENWLHPISLELQTSDYKYRLNLLQRINISIDVALALDYLHNHCEIPVIHCDLKPSNILLDKELTAHVGDFGLARILSTEPALSISSSIFMRGTIGYVAPEYGTGREVSTEGDLYSYGILILEMFTGKKPTDAMFNSDFNLHNFVKEKPPDRVMEIVDPLLIQDEGESTSSEQSARQHIQNMKCLVAILQVGLRCSANSPSERMEIKDVVSELHAVRKLLSSK